MKKSTAIVVGVGASAGLGAALCRKFSAEGYHVLVAGRTQEKIRLVADEINASGGSAHPILTDATCEDDVRRLLDAGISPEGGHQPVDLIVFNVGNNQPLEFQKLEASTFEEFWRVCCFAGFLVGREAVRRLVPLGRGTVIFTGASASMRGRPNYAHFSAAKAGLRMISQSMAREFGPQGIHVAHVVVDGMIKGDRVLSRYPDALRVRGEDGMLEIAAIAEAYWQIHKQPTSAWTHEMDLRPFREVF
ncbi:TPA: SDR family NAD(P)-dependent oxidoreductase [Burkholderia cenocepacia]|nr:SDR family NAD(P)-dependent oxidoreductase [Burkholderia cenocepacia]